MDKARSLRLADPPSHRNVRDARSGDEAPHEFIYVALDPLPRDLADIVVPYLLLCDAGAPERSEHPHPPSVWITGELQGAGPQGIDRYRQRR